MGHVKTWALISLTPSPINCSNSSNTCSRRRIKNFERLGHLLELKITAEQKLSANSMFESGVDTEIEQHSFFMREALAMSQRALENGEIPVGCVIVESKDDGRTIIAAGSNQTNESRNGTRHAEIVAVESLYASGTSTKPSDFTLSGSNDNSKGVLSKCDLYVTCEPCIMCAAALSKLGIRKVYFGCHNDRFGGNGSILSVHSNAYNNSKSKQTASFGSAHLNMGGVSDGCEKDTHKSSVSYSTYHNYDVEAGLLRDEAIELFQHFYTSENRRAPEAKRKRKVDKTFNSNTTNSINKET